MTDALENQAKEAPLSLSLLGARIGALLASNAELKSTLDQCARLLVSDLRAAFVRIWLLDEKENVLNLFVSQGQYTHLNGPHSRIPVGRFKIGYIAQDRKPHLTNEVVGDPRVSDQEWAQREGMVAFAGYPLIVGNRLEGVLALFSRAPMSEGVHLSLSGICDGIALAIERERNGRELRRLQERSQMVFDAVTDAFFGVDQDWNFVYVNRRFQEITGRTLESLKGETFWQVFPETVGTDDESRYREAARTGRTALFESHYAPLKLWTEVHVYPSAQGLSIYFQDISQRKRLEQKLRDTAKLESLGVMAGSIAHDFNNLLTGILGNASLLTDADDPQDRAYAEEIVNAAERAADLTRQMLAYAGKGRFEACKVDLSTQVRGILRLVVPIIDKKIELDLRLDENLPEIEADPGQMQQLLMNLVINAAESMGGAQGRVIITTGVSDEELVPDSMTFYDYEVQAGAYVFLEVQDFGCGMDEETKAKIFDPFFTTKFTGRGLGLAAVSGIIRGHHGAMMVSSAAGIGTTFKVFFPAAASSARVAPPLDITPTQGSGMILFVDDEPVVRDLGRVSLERRGYQVILASDGKEAVAVLEERWREIDLIVLDLMMPVMNGAEALVALRNISPEVPVVVSSGYNEVEVIRQFADQSVASFIQKPYTAAALIAKVQATLKASAR